MDHRVLAAVRRGFDQPEVEVVMEARISLSVLQLDLHGDEDRRRCISLQPGRSPENNRGLPVVQRGFDFDQPEVEVAMEARFSSRGGNLYLKDDDEGRCCISLQRGRSSDQNHRGFPVLRRGFPALRRGFSQQEAEAILGKKMIARYEAGEDVLRAAYRGGIAVLPRAFDRMEVEGILPQIAGSLAEAGHGYGRYLRVHRSNAESGTTQIENISRLINVRTVWEVSPAFQCGVRRQVPAFTDLTRHIESGVLLPQPLQYLRRWIFSGLEFLRCLVKQLLPVPRKSSWRRAIMGDPMPQNAPSSCTLVACTVCIEAHHRHVFESIYGAGTFPFKAACPRKLRNICHRTKFWNPETEAEKSIWSSKTGARIDLVLNIIMERGGIPTTNAPPRRYLMLPILGFNSYEVYDWSTSTWLVSRQQVARLIHIHGPCIVGLFVTWEYFVDYFGYDDNDDMDPVLYRGFVRLKDWRRARQDVDSAAGHHAVVCYAYKFVGEDLHLRVLDNQTAYGPRRWVLYEALETIATVNIKPIDASGWAY